MFFYKKNFNYLTRSQILTHSIFKVNIQLIYSRNKKFHFFGGNCFFFFCLFIYLVAFFSQILIDEIQMTVMNIRFAGE